MVNELKTIGKLAEYFHHSNYNDKNRDHHPKLTFLLTVKKRRQTVENNAKL